MVDLVYRLDHGLDHRRCIDGLDHRLDHRCCIDGLDHRRCIDGLNHSRAAEDIQRYADKADDIRRQTDAAAAPVSVMIVMVMMMVMMSAVRMTRRSGESLSGKNARCRQNDQKFCRLHVLAPYMLLSLNYTRKKSFSVTGIEKKAKKHESDLFIKSGLNYRLFMLYY